MRVFEHIEAEIVIPKVVYREISKGPKGMIRRLAIDQMKRTARVKVEDIEICSAEDKTYSVLSKCMGAGEAVDANIITMGQADSIWKKMKEDGLKLPSYNTFEDFYKKAS